MRTVMRLMLPMLAATLVGASVAAGAFSLQRVVVADANDRPRDVAIWLPGEGRALPLVVVLHGGPDLSFVERPRHVSRVLDYMVGAWPERERLDPARIGVYGFSVGGFTALVALGATPAFAQIPSYCAAPTLGFTFTPSSLAAVMAPMQLWRSARDEITAHPDFDRDAFHRTFDASVVAFFKARLASR
jgi:predicted dienelactone hydrolase